MSIEQIPTAAPGLNRWIYRPAPRVNARLRMFCFPYAGGSPSVFRGWVHAIPADVDVMAVRLPGRDSRIKEPAYREWPALLAAIEDSLLELLTGRFVFFGHSMGAAVAYELARQLSAKGKPHPAHLLLAGCRAPHVPRYVPAIHHLPDEEFYEGLRDISGTPPEVLADKKFMALFAPTLRADIKLAETWSGTANEPLDVPITVFAGADDALAPPDRIPEWGRYTTGRFTAHVLPGEHFFLRTSEDALVGHVRATLESC
ncbi:thioesterase [Sorangium cellulosum]|uniref:Thioesterase n=2 Tax=Polyangiaceae TaxID=49 RepID=A0A4P2QW64_SORCE|nr:thioesterase [Sorangium cellulosum]WCQ93947.1 Linear gramicidin dehydrogenase LgrE [Sorangium sp. Soce836]